MGTNFFINNGSDEEEQIHIGKRSAAGTYCWDCGKTLCKGGDSSIHMGGYGDPKWHSSCPRCGKRPKKESLERSSAGRELGFNKNPPKKKKGVSTCCSFSWAISPSSLNDELKKINKTKPVIDEYGTEYTKREFDAVLNECPVQYQDSIGQWFR